MSIKSDIAKFLIAILLPVILVLVGAGIAALGIYLGVQILFFTGLIVVGAGVLWGVGLVLLHGPADLFG